MRSRLIILKSLLIAVILFSVTLTGLELWLRAVEAPAPVTAGGSGLVEPCRISHHRLTPLRTVEIAHPDDGRGITVEINTHGLRGGEVVVPKPPGVFRVICLGDETVLGATLPEEDTTPQRLEHFLQTHTRQRVEVLNAGVPGDCPLLAALRMRHWLLAVQPDLIILHFDMSDVADDQHYRRYTRVDANNVPYACTHPLCDRRHHVVPWWAEIRLAERFAVWLDRSQRHDLTGAAIGEIDDIRASTAWLRDVPPDWAIYIEQSLAPIEEIRRMADGTYAAFLLSTCPQPWQVVADASSGPGVREAAGVPEGTVFSSRAPFEAIEQYAGQRGIAFCDASPTFQNDRLPARLFQTNSPKLTALGHELYARVLGNYIVHHHPHFTSPNKQPTPPADPQHHSKTEATAINSPYYE